MKFHQSLKFNSVPDWQDHYIDYDSLKKVIYNLQKKQLDLGIEFKENHDMFTDLIVTKSHSSASNSSDLETGEKSDDVHIHTTDDFNPLSEFSKEILKEVEKLNAFYSAKNEEITAEFNDLVKDLQTLDHNIFNFINHQKENKISRMNTNVITEEEDIDNIDSSDDDEDNYQSSILLNHKDMKLQKIINLKQRCKIIFIKLNELKSFIELNKIGFNKITKKFDKNLNYRIKENVDDYLTTSDTIFNSFTMDAVNDKIDKIMNGFVFISFKLDHSKNVDSVVFELNSYLRDHIIWERNTVWKDLLSLQNKKQDFSLNSNLLNLRVKNYKIPFTSKHVKLPQSLVSWQIFKLLLIIVVFVILLTVKTFADKVQARALAVLVAAAMLWASEALPLYTTAMLIPLLTVTCKILKDDDGNALGAADASSTILASMWNSVITILVGGFTLAAALSKYNIAKIISSWILAGVGVKPRYILLTIMLIALFLAMWISNVATPILCYSLIQQVLKTIPTDSPFAQALVLGIALASNMAGMSSPIASPQNVIGIQQMSPNPGWGNWFAVALPVSIIGTVLIWLFLILTFKINATKIKPFQPIKDPWTTKQIFIMIVTVATILLWCVESNIESTFGSGGIIAIVPVILFFGTGLLKTEDLNNFPWSIVLLAMGGQALGKGISSSGLLSTIALALQKKIFDYNVWVILIIFGIVTLVFATFVSHTVAALIIIPLVKEVGENLPENHANLLVMATSLLASAAMGLPTSGFPNVTAISMTDELGRRYLTVNTFINRGVPASIIAFIVVITIGYGIMNALNF